MLFIFQFDLVCDRAIYGTIASSLVFGGWIIGSVVIGSLADKFGRKTMSFLFGFFIALFSLLSAFPNVYWLFAIFRLIVGFSIGKYRNIMYQLTAEWTLFDLRPSARYRHFLQLPVQSEERVGCCRSPSISLQPERNCFDFQLSARSSR